MTIIDMGRKGREAAKRMASVSTEQKNTALDCITNHLLIAAGEILAANEKM
jgi:gamma-glutamyl phosphate reductase